MTAAWPRRKPLTHCGRGLAAVEIPVLLDSAYFASFLKQDKLNLFPAAAYTERPAGLLACARGKAVVLVAGCPYALIIPSFLPSISSAWTTTPPVPCLRD